MFTLGIVCFFLNFSIFHSIPVCDIRDYGAIGDNKTINTKAIIATITDCHQKYGPNNMVNITVADGMYITGSFNISSNTILYLNNNATIAGSTNPNDYNLCECLPPCGTPMYCPLIGSFNVTNISIIGSDDYSIHNPHKSLSNIDGRGEPWWYNFSKGLLKHQRPKLIEFANTNNINIHNITVFNSSFWTIHPIFSNNINISYINVFAPRAVGNTDGIDPDSAQNVHINNAYIDVGDDGIAIKSSKTIPSSNILMENIYILSRNFGIGSAVIGGIQNITLKNSKIGDNNGSSPWAIKIKTHRGQGAYVRDILFENIIIGDIAPNTWQQSNGGYDIIFTPDYGSSNEPLTPVTNVSNVIFRNITGYKDVVSGNLFGSNYSIWNHIIFENVILNNSQHGWNCKYVNISIKGEVLPKFPSDCFLSN